MPPATKMLVPTTRFTRLFAALNFTAERWQDVVRTAPRPVEHRRVWDSSRPLPLLNGKLSAQLPRAHRPLPVFQCYQPFSAAENLPKTCKAKSWDRDRPHIRTKIRNRHMPESLVLSTHGPCKSCCFMQDSTTSISAPFTSETHTAKWPTTLCYVAEPSWCPQPLLVHAKSLREQ